MLCRVLIRAILNSFVLICAVRSALPGWCLLAGQFASQVSKNAGCAEPSSATPCTRPANATD